MISAGRSEQFRVFVARWLAHTLCGVTFGDWLRLLRKVRFSIDPRYWPRAALLTWGSLSCSVTRWREGRLYGATIAAQRVPPPLFILGHWRTGTTHLHNLLVLDSRFAFPNTYQVLYPHSFLTTESMGARLIASMAPRRRLQDNVRNGPAEAQEDEFALCTASLLSPYLGWMFPRSADVFERYLTFRDVWPLTLFLVLRVRFGPTG